MTRINANINPVDLCDQHLLAEYREIVRIPNHVLKKDIDLNEIPNSYRLGPGHVKFFYNKIKFLHNRFLNLKLQLAIRNIKCTITDSSFQEVNIMKPELYNDVNLNYGNEIVANRIIERLLMMSKVKYYRESCDKQLIIQNLKNKYGDS